MQLTSEIAPLVDALKKNTSIHHFKFSNVQELHILEVRATPYSLYVQRHASLAGILLMYRLGPPPQEKI